MSIEQKTCFVVVRELILGQATEDWGIVAVYLSESDAEKRAAKENADPQNESTRFRVVDAPLE